MFRGRYNLYDALIVFLLAAVSAGMFGGAYSPPRMLAFAFSPFFFSKISILLNQSTAFFRQLVFGCSVFFAYVLFSMMWTPNQMQGGKEIVYYCTHFLLLLEIITFGRFAKAPLFSICFGWAVAVIITAPIAVYEVIYDVHLASSKFQSDVYRNFGGGVIMVRRFAAVTFGGQNGYSLFLVIGTLFSLCGMMISRRISGFLFFGMVSGFSSLLVVVNASRGAILSIGVEWVIFMLFYFRSTLRYKNFLLIAFSVGLITFAVAYSDILFAQIQARMINGKILYDAPRLSLMREGFGIFLNSGMIGCGIGGIENAYFALSSTATLLAPHNLLLECLVQYGLVGEILLLGLLFNIFRYGVKNPFFVCRFVAYAALLSFPFWSIINSNYLLHPLLWCVFGCLCFAVEYVPPYFANINVIRRFSVMQP